MDANLKAQVLQIAKSNNLLNDQITANDNEALNEASKAWQQIQDNNLLLLKELLDDYSDLKAKLKDLKAITNTDINFALIEEHAFTHELNTVMSLHTVISKNTVNDQEKEKIINSAHLTFKLQKSLLLPNNITRMVAKIMSLGMYAQISSLTHEFHEYLTILIPLLNTIKEQIQKRSLNLAKECQMTAKAHSENLTPDNSNQDTSIGQQKLALDRQILLLELVPIWDLVISENYVATLDNLEKYKEFLLSFSDELDFAFSIDEKKNYALFMLFISKLASGTKICAQELSGKYQANKHDNLSAFIQVEQNIQVAIDLADKLSMPDLEIIARSLKIILLLILNTKNDDK